MLEGWISLHRKIQENWIWEDKPFSRGQAFIDLLLKASHKDHEFFFNEQLIKIKRGELITSYRNLAHDWGWGIFKVKRFALMLKDEKTITVTSTHTHTVISICNYDKYQSNLKEEITATNEKRNANGTPTERRPTTYNNDNNDNNENNNNKEGVGDPVFELAVKIVKDVSEAHPKIYFPSELEIERVRDMITDLINQGYKIDDIRKAHNFAILDCFQSVDGFPGWRKNYTNPGNMLKLSNNGRKWIDMWIDKMYKKQDNEKEYPPPIIPEHECERCKCKIKSALKYCDYCYSQVLYERENPKVATVKKKG